MKRNKLWIAAGVFVLVILSSCVLQIQAPLVEGNVYIQYGWDTGVWSVADDNPAFLYVTAQNQNYLSETGTYYASYKTMYGGYYVFNYTLTADYAESNDPYGPLSTYFYIYLSNSGPILSDPVLYGRDLLQGSELPENLLKKAAESTPSIIATRENLGTPSGVIEKKVNGYTLNLEYWKIE